MKKNILLQQAGSSVVVLAFMAGMVLVPAGMVLLPATAFAQDRPAAGEILTRPTVTLDLSGLWTVKLDPDDAGITECWFATPVGGQPIRLPGTTDEAGYGTPVDRETMTYEGIDPASFVAGFGQSPDQRLDEMGRLVREHYYVGPAWYERFVDIPPTWKGGQVHLRLERTIWETRLWLDGALMGARDSLVTEHRYPLENLTPGRHRITLRVDNRPILPTGLIQHGYGEETQTRWNGIVGDLELIRTDSVRIESLRVFPSGDRGSVILRVRFGNGLNGLGHTPGKPLKGRLLAVVREKGSGKVIGRHEESIEIPAEARQSEGEQEIVVPLSCSARPWDEFDPALYEIMATVQVERPGTPRSGPPDANTYWSHTVTEDFGFRQIVRDGADIRLNGRRIFLRGVLDCAVYPLTGYPPMNLAGWLDIFGTVKSYGFNHVRFHTWCPPEAAFEAADRLGLYLAPEASFWPPGGPAGAPQLGEDAAVLDWIRREIRALSDRYGNHPSFCFFCIGNEFAGGTKWDVVDNVLGEAKIHDPRRLYNGSTARTRVATDDFWVTHVTPAGATRGIGPAHTDWDFRKSAADLPVISHETGQRPAFPDYDVLLPKFTGPLKAYNLERYRRLAVEAGIAPFEDRFARASALFALDQYKAEHEAFLRTPGWDGYQLLQLNDFTGQGEALVGLLDPFWAPKPGITAEAVRSWNAPTVPLARFEKYVFRSDETLEAVLELAHFGEGDLDGATARWELVADEGGTIASGIHGPFDAPCGSLSTIGRIDVPLAAATTLSPAAIGEAAGATLRVTVGDAVNSWRIWVYPPVAKGAAGQEEMTSSTGASAADRLVTDQPVTDRLVTNRFDDAARDVLAAGGGVLFLAHGLFNEHTEKTGYASVYWSAKMFAWAGNNSLGVLPAAGHPALDGFPHDGHSDWHWHELTRDATAFPFDRMPAGMAPIIQAIPDFHHARPLLHLFEVKVGPGRLIVCGYDLESRLEERPVAERLRFCLLRYMESDAFDPACEFTGREARRLFSGWEKDPRQETWRIADCDSEEQSGENGRARNVIDGDPGTIWHTEWVSRKPPHPHRITIDLGRVETVSGLRYLPRQDQANGRVGKYRLLVGVDGKSWAPAAEGAFPNDRRPRTIRFEAPLRARYVRLVALGEVNGNPWSSAAEICPVLGK
jgi:hypothetical protein